MKLRLSNHRSIVISTRLAGAMIACLFLATLSPATEPQWWIERGVIAKEAEGNRLPANDCAAVNQGQVKNIAFAAVAELNAHLPDGAGEALNQLAVQLSGTN